MHLRAMEIVPEKFQRIEFTFGASSDYEYHKVKSNVMRQSSYK